MTISEQIQSINTAIELFTTLSQYTMVAAIVFFIAYKIFRVLAYGLSTKNYPIPIGVGTTVKEITELFMKNGYLCNIINDTSFSVTIPRAPKITPIIFEVILCENGSNLLTTKDDRNDDTKSFLYIQELIRLAYTTFVYEPSGEKDIPESVEDSAYRLYKNKSGKNAIILLVVSVLVFGGCYIGSLYAEDYYSQPDVVLQQGIEDTFGVNLSGTDDYDSNDSDSSYNDYSDYGYEESDDTYGQSSYQQDDEQESDQESSFGSNAYAYDNGVLDIPNIATPDPEAIDYYELSGLYEDYRGWDASISMYTSDDESGYVGTAELNYKGKTYTGFVKEIGTNVFQVDCDDGSQLLLAMFRYDGLLMFQLFIDDNYEITLSMTEHYES